MGQSAEMGDGERDLVTSEGVDEGSARSGSEGIDDEQGSVALGEGAAGTPVNGEQQAAPEPVQTGEQEPPGPGQRNEVGEG